MKVDSFVFLAEKVKAIIVVKANEGREKIRDVKGGVSLEGLLELGDPCFRDDIRVESVNRGDSSIIPFELNPHGEFVQRILRLFNQFFITSFRYFPVLIGIWLQVHNLNGLHIDFVVFYDLLQFLVRLLFEKLDICDVSIDIERVLISPVHFQRQLQVTSRNFIERCQRVQT